MRVILVILIGVILMALAGWIAVSVSSNNATVELNRERIESDTDRALEKSKEIADKVDEASRKASEEIRKTKVDIDVSREETVNAPRPLKENPTLNEPDGVAGEPALVTPQ